MKRENAPARPQAVTSEQFATALLELMRQSAQGFCAELQKHAAEKWPDFNQEEIEAMGDQVFVPHLWVLSKILGRNRKVLDLLHDGYLVGFYNAAQTREEGARAANVVQSRLIETYETYYRAWADDVKAKSAMALSFEMTQAFFPKRKPVLDPVFSLLIAPYIVGLMESAVDFRQQFTITDN
jgi:hypothetical protein